MRQLILTTAFIVQGLTIFAQSNPTNSNSERQWAVEADLLVPFVPEAHIITLRASKTIQGNPLNNVHGDIIIGAYIRPHITHDIVYTIDEYLATVGYRQFLWKGLHVEGQLDVGKAWGTNRIDNQYYNKFALLGEGHVGYRLLFSPKKSSSFYLNPQVGIIHGLVTDIGPRGGKSDTFFSAKINLGFNF